MEAKNAQDFMRSFQSYAQQVETGRGKLTRVGQTFNQDRIKQIFQDQILSSDRDRERAEAIAAFSSAAGAAPTAFQQLKPYAGKLGDALESRLGEGARSALQEARSGAGRLGSRIGESAARGLDTLEDAANNAGPAIRSTARSAGRYLGRVGGRLASNIGEEAGDTLRSIRIGGRFVNNFSGARLSDLGSSIRSAGNRAFNGVRDIRAAVRDLSSRAQTGDVGLDTYGTSARGATTFTRQGEGGLERPIQISEMEDSIDPEGSQFVSNTRIQAPRVPQPRVQITEPGPSVASEELPATRMGQMNYIRNYVPRPDEPSGYNTEAVVHHDYINTEERPQPSSLESAEAGETEGAVGASEDAAAATGEAAAETVGEAAAGAAAEGGLLAGALEFLGPISILAGLTVAGIELAKVFTKKDAPTPKQQAVSINPSSFGRPRENIAPASNTAMTYQGGVSAF